MKAQLMLEMTLMLLVSVSLTFFVAAVFATAGGSYASGTDSMSAYYARSTNALTQEIAPYGEFHIISTNG